MKKIINLLLLVCLVFLFAILFFVDLPLSSPLSNYNFTELLTVPKNTKKQIVYGFLPFWNLEQVNLQPELTDLSYFSLTLNADGSIKTREENYADPGFNKLSSDKFLSLQNYAIEHKINNQITISQLNNTDIEEFINSPTAQEKFYQELDSLFLAYPFNGVNIDIEYVGEASDELREKYAEFIKNTQEYLQKKYSKITLSIDVYAAAATKKMIWDIPKLQSSVDYMIVMAYDFYRSSSSQAGPVAPLFMKKNSWQESIHLYLKDFAEKIPTKKIILGIPFYGYEWQTTTREPESFTYPKSGATASYSRIQELKARGSEINLQDGWDETALEPYLTYSEDDKFFTIYYENEKSLKYKLDFVKQLDLGGIAIWSLGYEGNSRELWDVIKLNL
ncbi:MAG: hypothetical protein AUK08_04575 [Candidatus Pacebacteria bacterium CG2_30_36_39]|nr:hypothetical protein [Candidatus Pacearchaeota archaeon]OIP73805.1 MAG: hypothetical protein AUK08_04575 [Candidatus Pacebacteria bacterium CG2_30_36_39]